MNMLIRINGVYVNATKVHYADLQVLDFEHCFTFFTMQLNAAQLDPVELPYKEVLDPAGMKSLDV